MEKHLDNQITKKEINEFHKLQQNKLKSMNITKNKTDFILGIIFLGLFFESQYQDLKQPLVTDVPHLGFVDHLLFY